jgi:molybdopterin-guanine dinucleotide biosynthesis protein A
MTRAVGVILAGGRARRLDGDKAGALLGEQTLLAHAVELVRAAGLEPVVCARADTELPPVNATVWREPGGGDAHPLAGLAWALEQASGPVVALPVDLPLLPPEVLTALAERREPLAVLAQDGRPTALVVRAGPEHAAALADAARAGAPALRTLVALGAALIELTELTELPPGQALLNVNDAADLARAEELRRAL